MEKKILEWFANGETGISSETMAFTACGLKGKWSSHPSDPSDFNRCLMLLNVVPEIRQHMDKIAEISPAWAKLIERWGDVESCFIEEVGFNWCKGERAPKTYELMKQIGC